MWQEIGRNMMKQAIRQGPYRAAEWRDAPIEARILPFPAKSGFPLMDAFFASTPAALCLLDRQMRFMALNDAMADILGSPTAQLIGTSVMDIDSAFGLIERCYALADADGALSDQEVVWRGRQYQLSFNPVRGPKGSTIGLAVSAFDISRRAYVEQRLRESRRRLLTTIRRDHLTGLLNRRGLEATLNRQLRRARRGHESLALLIVDIDWFKAFNDDAGHVAGDDCLRTVAAALRDCLRPEDAAGRYGGEEFVLLLPGTDQNGASVAAENCRRAIEELNIAHPTSIHRHVTISIGAAAIVPSSDRGPVAAQAAAFLKAADQALYGAKDGGRNRVFLA